MRLYDDVGQLQQFGRGIGRGLEYVQRGMAEAAFGERLDKRALVNDAAARDADERALRAERVNLRAERVNHGGGDEMASLRAALAGDHQVVATLRQLDRI